MPRARRVCTEPGCPTLTDTGRCDQHKRQADRARGSRQERGYDAAHERERKRWARLLPLPCARCGRLIQRTDKWHLDHTDDRSGYLGPSCAACNVSAAHRK